MKIRTALPAAVVVLGIALAGCSSDDSASMEEGMDMGSGSGTSAETETETEAEAEAGVEFNDADVTFTRGMYPHHAQAVMMSDLVDGRTDNPEIVELAAQISAAQAPEMEQMTTLLEFFGEPVPMEMDTESGETESGEMGDTDMSEMSGMMSAEDMSALGAASGAEFDRMWLTMMITHHTGAIEMSEVELDEGINAEAQQLATDIIAAQEAEIATMNGLLEQG